MERFFHQSNANPIHSGVDSISARGKIAAVFGAIILLRLRKETISLSIDWLSLKGVFVAALSQYPTQSGKSVKL
ncbi:MAG: hypothetical protein HXX08_03335 [Chloroflexi bacterium]|uniref:Uncharacterized protein n=1 Tax=Candidatus Chlorohelix allophototropha TaxID=3003348 RepID=A0A8T7LZC0_9CHLR|nr:hypothetical protein [Chloroflexota bacterium]WJW66770.1 hypothetical protein OZ401_000015 [Chloroflexota bacterium L227-S17]